MRLLVEQGRHLSSLAQVRLERAILAGPPRKLYRDDLEPQRWQELVERSIWLNLPKLNASGVSLGPAARERFADLSEVNPQWQLAANERDEFSHWMSGTGDPDYESSRDRDRNIAPRKRQELVQWLRMPAPERGPFYEDTWRETCRMRFFHSWCALCDLAGEEVWPISRWREALQVWSEEGQVLRSWSFAAPLVQTMPNEILLELAHAVTWWLEAASKALDRHEAILLNLCRRVLALPLEPEAGISQNGEPIDEPVTEAINHPVGHVTQALLNVWLGREPNDNEKLPDHIEPLFTRLCDDRVNKFRHGRVLLASRLISLFRVDQLWTETHLLPLFDWGSAPRSEGGVGGLSLVPSSIRTVANLIQGSISRNRTPLL